MASTILSDNGVSSGSAGLKSSADSTGVLALQTSTSGGAATTALTIDTSQNVGIGTSSTPATANYKTLAISGTTGAEIFLQTGSTNYGYIYADNGGFRLIAPASGAATGTMQFSTSNTERMRIDNAGNVLVGTTTQKNTTFGGGSSGITVANTGAPSVVVWDKTDTTYVTWLGQAGASGYLGNNANGPLVISTNGTERMRITSAGYVGIGTTTPQNALVVSNGGAGGVEIDPTGYITSYNRNTSASQDLYIRALQQYFYSNGTERMRIDSSGSVAIGSTSTASATRLTLKGAGTGGNTLFNCQDSGGNALLTITENGVVNLPFAVSGDAHLKIQQAGVTTLGAVASSGISIGGGGSNNQLCQIGLGYSGTYQPTAISSITTTQSGYTIADLIFATRGVNTDTAPSEKMRIVSDGNIRLGMQSYSSQPSSSNYGVSLNNTNAGCNFFASANSTQTAMAFGNLNGVVGSIQTNGSNTSFNTSSDYRLKENIAPMTGALDKVLALKPCTYNWKVDGADGEGFIAHELAEVCSHAVTGSKDGVEDIGNVIYEEDGSITQNDVPEPRNAIPNHTWVKTGTRPIYQGIDVSFLVATLTAAIQELKIINDTQAETINALTARIEALENRT